MRGGGVAQHGKLSLLHGLRAAETAAQTLVVVGHEPCRVLILDLPQADDLRLRASGYSSTIEELT